MGSFKTYTVTWWQVGLLKVSLIALGILIGSTWYEFFGRWTPPDRRGMKALQKSTASSPAGR